MPGKSNIKKKIVSENIIKIPKKRGRPPKETPIDSTKKETVSLTHVTSLSKRTSEMSKFYDLYVGPALERFPPKQLPVRRLVLQRYRALRAESHTASKASLVSSIYNR